MSPTLLEKLRAATGGDREIDALIAEHFGESQPWSYYATGLSEMDGEEVWARWSDEGGGWWMWGPKDGALHSKAKSVAACVRKTAPHTPTRQKIRTK